MKKVIIDEYLKKYPRVNRKKLLLDLFEKDNHCYYCKVETKMYEELRNDGPSKGTPFPDDMATIGHLYGRLDFRRYTIPPLENMVLACHKCNKARNSYQHKALPHEIQIKLSKLNKPRGKSYAIHLLENEII